MTAREELELLQSLEAESVQPGQYFRSDTNEVLQVCGHLVFTREATSKDKGLPTLNDHQLREIDGLPKVDFSE